MITISSPKSKNDQEIDENDLNLILEDTVDQKVVNEEDVKEKEEASAKKRVPLVTLSKDDKKKRVPLTPADSSDSNGSSEKKRVPFVTLSSK